MNFILNELLTSFFLLNVEYRMSRPNARPIPPQIYPLIVSGVFFLVIFVALLRE